MLINPVRQRVLSWRESEIMHMPLGLAYIATFLLNNGHSVKIIERRFFYKADYWNDAIMEEINHSTKKAIEDFLPDLVGVTATTPLIMDAFRTVKLAKEVNKDIITLVGGAHPTAHPEFTLKQCQQLDLVCRGDGEMTTLEIANGMPWDKIEGLTYRKDAEIVTNPARKYMENLDFLPYPARELFDTKFYFRPTDDIMRGLFMVSATIYTARGCPFKCTFCQSPQLATACSGKYLRLHSPDYIIKEIQHLYDKYNIRGVFFADDMFTITKKRSLEICGALIKSGLNKKIKYVVQTRTDSIDDEVMMALKDSGCYMLIFGCETGSDETLARMNKKTTVAKNLSAIKLAHKYKVNCSSNTLIGTFGETEKDLLKTIKFLKQARPDMISVAKFAPLPGSADYVNLANRGILKSVYENWDEIFEKYVESDYTFADMSREGFRKLANKLKREVYLYTNFRFEIKTNIKKDFSLCVEKFIRIILQIGILYLPLSFQDRLKTIIAKISHGLRYICYGKNVRE